MKSRKLFATFLMPLLATVSLAEETPLFDGESLDGWSGDPRFWSVEDGAIVGRTTAENPAPHNTFLIWEGGQPGDFELTLKFRMKPGDERNYCNSGIQIRSRIDNEETWIVGGYQADFEYGDSYSGIVYEERGRGILAQRGQRVTLTQGDEPGRPNIEVTGEVGDSAEIQAAIKKDDWNDYRIVAEGNRLRLFINGLETADLTDETAEAAKEGVIALQLHSGPPMQVEFKDIVLKK